MFETIIVEILPLILTFVLPVLFIPFLMRLIIGRIVLFIAKRKFLSKSLLGIQEGWKNKDDEEAIKAVSKIALKRLKYHFLFQYRFREDAEAVLVKIKEIFEKDNNKQNKQDKLFSFSIKKLIYCFLLGFCDLYREFGNTFWFKFLERTRMVWFSRVLHLNKYYKQVTGFVLVEALRKTRLLGRIIRIILIPLLGVPILLWYAVRSILITIFMEGFSRFIYGIMLLKVGYYAVYLYGRENTVINKRIKMIPRTRLNTIHKEVERIISPKNWEDVSLYYENAVKEYIRMLNRFEMSIDKSVANKRERFSEITLKLIDSFITKAKRAYQKQNPFLDSGQKDLENLFKLYSVLGDVYFPKIKEPFYMLRFGEILRLGYMACIILLDIVFFIPGSEMLLDKFSLDFALKVKDLSKRDIIKNSVAGIKRTYKYINFFNKVRKVYRIARGIISPYSLVLTLGGPVVMQHIQDLIREYVYHRTGRLLIYGFELNKLKKKEDFKPLLW